MTDTSVTTAAAPPLRVGTRDGLWWGLGLVVAVLGFSLPWLGLPRNLLSLLTSAGMTAMLATAVGFLVRQAGLSSFGHAAFYGGAAYLIALMVAYSGWPAWAIVLTAPLIVMAVAFALSFVLLRTEGVAYSMLSLAVAQALNEMMMRWREIANGEDGLRIRLPRELFGLNLSFFQRSDTMFLVTWGALVLAIAALALLGRSHFGTLTVAIKNNQERARFIGYRTLLPRATVVAVSALVAAVGGTLFALYNAYVTPGLLHWTLSGEALIIAIIGGTRAFWGPALGAFVFVCLRDVVGNYTTHWQAIVGIVLIAVVIAAPNGLSGAIRALVSRQRGGING